jgi:hypothetical protein
MADDHRITLGDKERWRKHYRSFKRQAYAMSFGSLEYKKNFDRINWKVKRADDPFLGVPDARIPCDVHGVPGCKARCCSVWNETA